MQRADTAGGTVLATWTYDTVANGLLTSTSRMNGATTLHTYAVGSYDDGYRPLSTTEFSGLKCRPQGGRRGDA